MCMLRIKNDPLLIFFFFYLCLSSKNEWEHLSAEKWVKSPAWGWPLFSFFSFSVSLSAKREREREREMFYHTPNNCIHFIQWETAVCEEPTVTCILMEDFSRELLPFGKRGEEWLGGGRCCWNLRKIWQGWGIKQYRCWSSSGLQKEKKV